VKFYIAHQISSLSLRESGFANISGFFLSIGVIVANGAFLADTSVWFLDPTFAILISFSLAGVGVYTMVIKRSNFWWKKPFWCPTEADAA